MDNPISLSGERHCRISGTQFSRLLAFCGLVFIIKGISAPAAHHRAVLPMGIVALLAQLVGYVAIIVTGWYPRGLFDFQVGVLALDHLRTNAWFLSIVDEYPPFRLQE